MTHWTNGDEIVEIRGTGFFIIKGETVYFVTNRHVVEPGYSNKEFLNYTVSDFFFESYESFDEKGLPKVLKKISIHNYQDFVFHPNENNDVACLRAPQIIGSDFTLLFGIKVTDIANNEWISTKLSVCDSIAYPGFPIWHDQQNNTPIFRMGTIASDPRLNYSVNPSGAKAAQIAYEGFSSGGASGSPIFAVQKGFRTGVGIQAPDDFFREVKVIGINAGHFSDEGGHSGISFFYKSSVILDIIDKDDIDT